MSDKNSVSSKKMPRSCNDCTACCKALRIDSIPGFSTRLDTGEDIAKKAGEVCVFLHKNGCSIYEVRPLVCRRFKCDWLEYRKGFADKDKPSKIGVLGVRGIKIII
ncbi:MAG: YkgJ family cysteine cluster protein [Myxococcales bacterium]|nr:YkgJ family cysteine cluster protein [Myxococcales bacterium]USN51209.1 MAG: YkgJ family cysteine cluster protein [Myxococcales bacterium]